MKAGMEAPARAKGWGGEVESPSARRGGATYGPHLTSPPDGEQNESTTRIYLLPPTAGQAKLPRQVALFEPSCRGGRSMSDPLLTEVQLATYKDALTAPVPNAATVQFFRQGATVSSAVTVPGFQTD